MQRHLTALSRYQRKVLALAEYPANHMRVKEKLTCDNTVDATELPPDAAAFAELATRLQACMVVATAVREALTDRRELSINKLMQCQSCEAGHLWCSGIRAGGGHLHAALHCGRQRRRGGPRGV